MIHEDIIHKKYIIPIRENKWWKFWKKKEENKPKIETLDPNDVEWKNNKFTIDEITGEINMEDVIDIDIPFRKDMWF